MNPRCVSPGERRGIAEGGSSEFSNFQHIFTLQLVADKSIFVSDEWLGVRNGHRLRRYTGYEFLRKPVPKQSISGKESPPQLLNDPNIDLVAECIGGIHPALEYVLGAMEHGKHVVTANKALVSAHFEELENCARKNGVQFRFTPSAGGGIPWLYNLQRAGRCDTIEEVHGIVNGTCNYILDLMHTKGSDFAEVLRDAQDLGYAESDPGADIEGWDTQRKCVISANLAFGTIIPEDSVPVLGIHHILAEDIAFFNENGLTCRLLMNASLQGDAVSAYVEPTLLTSAALESGVGTNFNMVSLTGKNVGPLSFYGQGAGKMPTGTSLVHDIIDIKDGISFSPSASTGPAPSKVDNTKTSHPYYFSTCGVLEEQIALEQFSQYNCRQQAPMAFRTYALASIRKCFIMTTRSKNI